MVQSPKEKEQRALGFLHLGSASAVVLSPKEKEKGGLWAFCTSVETLRWS